MRLHIFLLLKIIVLMRKEKKNIQQKNRGKKIYIYLSFTSLSFVNFFKFEINIFDILISYF